MSKKEIKYHRLYIDLAERVSQMSYARRLKVGSVLVKNDNIISFSWNGTPSGFDNNCEHESIDSNGNQVLTTKSEVLHAESNVLLKAARNGVNTKDSILYITHAPCLQCAKLILQSGIKEVFYKNVYREVAGIYFLNKCGIKVTQL